MENGDSNKRSEKKSDPENSVSFSSVDCFIINPLEHCDDNNIPDVGYPDSEGDDMMNQQNDLSNVSVGGTSVSEKFLMGSFHEGVKSFFYRHNEDGR